MPNNADDNLMAIIMLGDTSPPDDEALARAIRARIPGVPFATSSGADHSAPSLFFERGAMCSVMRVDKPAPISPNDSAFTSAWYWPGAWEALKNHKSHMLISVSGADAKTRAALFCQLVAAGVEAASSPLGVHFATPDALLPAQTVPGMEPPESDSIATMFVVAAKLSRDAGKPGETPSLSAFTVGLSNFDLMEIEAIGFKGEPAALNVLLLEVASYLLIAGPVLKDGDTVGPDETTKITVRQEPSRFRAGSRVYRLHFNGRFALNPN